MMWSFKNHLLALLKRVSVSDIQTDVLKPAKINNQSTRTKPFIFTALLLLGLAVSLGMISKNAQAISASPRPFEMIQPDGTKIILQGRGDEYFHWLEDLSGYTVVRANGKYVYAQLNKQNRLVPTSWEVGKVNPKAMGLAKKILPPSSAIQKIRKQKLSSGIKDTTTSQAEPPQKILPIGTVKNLVVLIRFSNHTTRTLPSNADFNVLFNQAGGDSTLAPTGSINDLYSENSYGQLDLQSTIVGWINVSGSEQFYANGVSGDATLWNALREALDTADATIDFTDFDSDNDGYIDAITFVHSGYGAEHLGIDADGTSYENRIWSHKWQISPEWESAEGVKVGPYNINPGLWDTSGSDIGRIGVIAHELGHFLGLPDLYDTNGGGEGIGSYGLMANSWGFDFEQLNPPHLSAWSKIDLGWVTPTVVTASGNFILSQAEFNADIIRIDNGFPPGEYLLLENRQPVGIESIMPQGGLAIWHIDEAKLGNTDEGYPGQSGWPENNRHYRVALLQADGDYDLETGLNRGDNGDLFHGLGVDNISGSTSPNTDRYQNGVVSNTGIDISTISESGATMSLTIDLVPPPPPPEECSAGTSPVFAFQDNLENTSSGNWANTVNTGVNHWNGGAGTPDIYFTSNPNSGSFAFRGVDFPIPGDSSVEMANDILIPTNGFMTFQHQYDFETSWDGGVVEYSTTGGATWTDAGSLIVSGPNYISTLNTGDGSNPLAGRSAFTGSLGFYSKTVIDLGTLAGQNVRFRFRVGTDSSVGATDWDIDDVEIYNCGVANQAPTITSDGGGAVAAVNAAENQTAVTDVQATDDNDSEGNGLSYALSGGADQALFQINANSGVLTFIAAPDFENPTDAGANNVYDVQVTVNDSGNLTDTQDIAVTVTDVAENGAPSITSEPLTTATEALLYSYDVNATDPDTGDTLSFSLDTAPTGMTIDASTGLIQWTPAAAQAGNNNVTVRVSDSGGLSDTQSFTIVVSTSTNQAPVLNPIGAQSIEEGLNLNFSVTASDDGPASELRLTASGLPTGATFTDNGNGNGIFDWTPGITTAGTYNVTFTATDLNGSGLPDSEVVQITVNAPGGGQTPFGGSPWAIPGQVEMEDYDVGGEGIAYHDTAAGNSGNQYRSDDVDIWLSTSEGYYTGANRAGEWLEFTIDVANPGNHQLELRFATPNSNRNVHVEFNGIDVTGPITLPNTGGWQSWQTLSVPVTLNAGQQVMRVAIDGNGMNLNWIRLTASGGGNQAPVLNPIGAQSIEEGLTLNFPLTASDDGPASELQLTASGLPTGATFNDDGNGNGTFNWIPGSGTAGTYNVTFTATDLNGSGLPDSEVVQITVNAPGGGQTPYGGTPWAVPGQIEIENYDLGGEGIAYHDSSTGNNGSTYRSDDIDIWSSAAEGFYAGSNKTGEWLEYTVDVAAAGNYLLELRFATPNSNRKVHVEFDGADVSGPVTLPNTGGWQAWQTLSIPVSLNAGQQIMRLSLDGNGMNLNWLRLTAVGGGNQAPVLSAIGPQTIEEGLNLNLPITATDDGPASELRLTASGLPTGATFTDNGNGNSTFNWTPGTGTAGTYNVTFTATDLNGSGLPDSEVVQVTVNAAGGGQTPFGGTPWAIPGQIEIEDYDLGGEGIAYHDTTTGNSGSQYRTDDIDIWSSAAEGYYAGGNKTGEWLEYTVNVASSGNYTLQLRVATPRNGKRLHVEFGGVDVSGAIAIPNTGGWQAWQTLSIPVTLNAGQQIMRIAIDQGGLNLNRISVQ